MEIKILGFNKLKTLALQVGGSDKNELSLVCKIAEDMGRDEKTLTSDAQAKKSRRINLDMLVKRTRFSC